MNPHRLRIIAILFGCLAPLGPAPGPAAAGEEAAGPVLIKDVPHVRQKPDFCGEACAEMWLRRLGHATDQDHVFDRSGVDPVLGRGCRTPELKTALDRIGFRTGDVWFKVEAARAAEGLEAQWARLLADLRDRVPSIVCMRYADQPETTEHFRLVLGYDRANDEVVYHEPAEDRGAYMRMKRELFLKLWPLKYSEKEWTLVRLRLEPGKIEAGAAAPAGTFTSADYCQEFLRLNRLVREKLPGQGFAGLVQPPFVVLGNEDAATVRERARGTVRWAAEKLKADYFRKDPAEIIVVWLFKDKDSYEKCAAALFGDKPSTPFGYYSQTNSALVMNIATGGGTLVHEMVHPFVHSDFPECPAWLNEGLGSLYEQCGEKDGRIWGYTNWRLPGLQKAIGAGPIPTFRELTATTSAEFYGKDKGTNYAQARYLCYWLQEQGKLAGFYKEFRDNAAKDPSGYTFLMKAVGEKDEEGMKAFQKKWEEFVLGLKFR
ncbi:MAG TPA: C39 family peptidase [Planctomycetota bacterium]|nr:C39 family peptidase [Planctomycetota bacterium]